MKGCPHCDKLKNKLNEYDIKFTEIDVDENPKSWETFAEAVNTEYLPSVLIGKKAFIPERSFKTIEQGVEIIRNYLLEHDQKDHHSD
jgi:glutaredoxin